MLDAKLRAEILKGAGVSAVSLKRGDSRELVLKSDDDIMVDESFDLRHAMILATIPDAISALFSTSSRDIHITDIPPNMSGELIEVALHERPMITAMRGYAVNILVLSVVLSLLVAAMVYWALNRVLVRPIERLSATMTRFRENPEDASRIITPSQRTDEIGNAERELSSMQTQLASLLQQKTRLAALGLAVSKISHELRNMLTSAQLMSDRLSGAKDETVQRMAPKLISSIDRAISYLNQTLTYGRAEERPPQRRRIALKPAIDEVLELHRPAAPGCRLENHTASDITVDVDRDHLNRILANLLRNATQAFDQQKSAALLPPCVFVRGFRQGSVTQIEVADNGPGIPEKARQHLFEAFQSSAKAGGTGLGLAIVRELIQAHGGTIDVTKSDETGTIFLISIPDQLIDLSLRRTAAPARSDDAQSSG
jgi:signal transduction histidine kinase